MSSFNFNTNTTSLSAQRQLTKANEQLKSAFERLSSGLRINKASDDAAGLAIATALSSDSRVYTQGIRNLNDGISALSIVDETFGALSNIVTRQRELAEQAANGVYSSEERAALDEEAQALRSEYNRIVQSSSFNKVLLLDGDIKQMVFQGGYGADGALTATFRDEITSEDGVEDAGTTTDTTITQPGSGTVLDHAVLVGDLNNDGRDDIVQLVSVNRIGTARLYVKVHQGNEDGSFTQIYSSNVTSSTAYNPSFGEIDAQLRDSDLDGDLDILVNINWIGSPGGTDSERLENLFVENGSFSMDLNLDEDSVTPTGDESSHGGTTYGVGDFNGDGFDDDLTVNYGVNVQGMVHDTVVTYSTSLESLLQDSFSISTQSAAQTAVDSFTDQINELAVRRGEISATLNRIEVATAMLTTTRENYASAEARITDADIAEETTKMLTQQMLSDTITAVLAQANLEPQIALQLLAD